MADTSSASPGAFRHLKVASIIDEMQERVYKVAGEFWLLASARRGMRTWKAKSAEFRRRRQLFRTAARGFLHRSQKKAVNAWIGMMMEIAAALARLRLSAAAFRNANARRAMNQLIAKRDARKALPDMIGGRHRQQAGTGIGRGRAAAVQCRGGLRSESVPGGSPVRSPRAPSWPPASPSPPTSLLVWNAHDERVGDRPGPSAYSYARTYVCSCMVPFALSTIFLSRACRR